MPSTCVLLHSCYSRQKSISLLNGFAREVYPLAARPGLGIAACVVLLYAGAYATVPTGRDLLPPPSEPLVFSGIPPEHSEAAPGYVFTGTLFTTGGPSNTRIQVRDVLVQEIAAFPRPVLLEVLQSQGPCCCDLRRIV
jgi:hypothetical protein